MTKGRCIHCSHQGIKITCAKGHDPAELARKAAPKGVDHKLGLFYRIPCDSVEWHMERLRSQPHQLSAVIRECLEHKATCADFTDPTDEQIDEYQLEMKRGMDRMNKVIPVISQFKRENAHKRLSQSVGRRGKVGEVIPKVVDCPCCGKKLMLQFHTYNGHVHGRCETEDCVSWME